MDVNEISGYAGKYFKAADFTEPRQFVVEAWEVVTFGDGSEKIVLSLEGETRCLVLNKSNCRNVVNGTGSSETDAWIGATIEVSPIEGTFKGKAVRSFRVNVLEAAVF